MHRKQIRFQASRADYAIKDVFVWTLVVLLGRSILLASEVKIQLPPETGSFKTGTDMELANGQCLACHSVEYVETQPAFPLSFWTAEIKKMRDKFGAAIPEQQIAPLANYLARSYGIETNLPPTSLVKAEPVLKSEHFGSLTGEALATHYGCLTCHNVARQVIGPAFSAVAEKYRNDSEALERIRGQIHNGGKGKPGTVVMPPFPMVSDSEAARLATWIMAQGPTTNSSGVKR